MSTPWENMWGECILTLKQRADFPPAGDASLTGELTQGSLQEKHGDTTAHKEDDIWNEERTLMHTKENTQRTLTPLHLTVTVTLT